MKLRYKMLLVAAFIITPITVVWNYYCVREVLLIGEAFSSIVWCGSTTERGVDECRQHLVREELQEFDRETRAERAELLTNLQRRHGIESRTRGLTPSEERQARENTRRRNLSRMDNAGPGGRNR